MQDLLGRPFFLFLCRSIFAYFSFVVLPVAAPPGGHDSDATTARFILSLFSPLAFAFCPAVLYNKFFFIYFSFSYQFIIYFA